MTVTLDVVAWELAGRNPVFWAEEFRKFQLDGVFFWAADTPLEDSCVYGCTSEQWEALPGEVRRAHHFLVVDTTGLRRRLGRFPPSNLLLVDGDSLIGVMNQIIRLFSRLTRWDRACHREILDGCGLPELVGRLSALIPYPALVFDPGFQVIASTKAHTVSIAGFETAVQLGYTAPDRMETLRRKRMLSRLDRTDRCILDRAASDSHQYNAYRKHCKEGRVVAYSCIFFGEHRPSGGYLDLAECFFQNLDFYFAQAARLDQAGGYMYEYLMADLIQNRCPPGDQRLLDRLRYIDLPLEASFFLVNLEPEGREDMPPSYICNLIRMSCPGIRPFLLEHTIFILLASQAARPERAQVESLLDALRLPLRSFSYQCFVSSGFRCLTGLYDAAIQCGAARELAARHIRPGFRVLYYEDCWLFHCFRALEERMSLPSIYPDAYVRLADCDARSGGDGLSLIQAFLRCNCDYKVLAGQLGIHRNTAAYRIQKICTGAQLDLTDYDTRLSLALAFRLRAFLDGSGAPEPGPERPDAAGGGGEKL